MQSIADACFASLTATPEGLRVTDPEAVRRALAATFGKAECVEAAREVVVVAHFCAHSLRAPEAGEALLRLAEATIPTLRQFSTSMDALRADDKTRERLLGLTTAASVPAGAGGGGLKWWELKR